MEIENPEIYQLGDFLLVFPKTPQITGNIG